MTKSQYSKVILITVVLTLFFDLFLGRYVLAKISTLPVLNRLKILSPQAPIVINNKETVRVSDSGDAVSSANSAKSKISTIVVLSNNGSVTVTGSAINLTSDGTFLTGSKSIAKDFASYFVILSDGRNAKITSAITDPATGLLFVRAGITNVPVANFSESKDLSVGEKVLFVHNSVQNFISKGLLSFVTASEKDIQGQVFSSDFPKMSFGASATNILLSGEVLVNTSAEVVGIWNGENIVASTNIKKALALFYNNNEKIIRPSYGFTYSIITQNESKLTGVKTGALVKDITSANTKLGGLINGDIILRVDNDNISEDLTLEEVLQKYKPGDKITFNIFRKNSEITLSIIAGELK